MRNLIPGWIWISGTFLVLIGATEYFVDSGDQFAFIKYPMLQLVFLVALLILIATDLILKSVQNVMFQTLSEEAKEKYLAAHEERNQKFNLIEIYHRLMGSSEERDIELEHNYDGIKELDNKLPPWWLYSFYASIIFAVGYIFYYHMFDGDSQLDEYETELALAKVAIEEYKENAPDLVDAETVVALTEPADLEEGASIYQVNCVACHGADGGGGIGPNLVDEYWILGGGIKNIFHTISEGGRSGKGMIAWNSSLKPTEIQQVASYILSLQGTSPAQPKAAEGEVWVSE